MSTPVSASNSAVPSTPVPSPAPSTFPSTSASPSASSEQSFWQYWTSEPLTRPRYSALWWRDTVLVLVVFSITGSLSLYLVRPLLSYVLGVNGSLRDGPNSYRVLSVLLVSPVYSIMLLIIGTLVGQHFYFRKVAMRMWGRLLPKRWVGGGKKVEEKLQ